MFEVKQLTAGYESRTIFENLNVTIPSGKITAIIGPNGCGKSTLLKSLSRLIVPQSGEVIYQGSSLKDRKQKWISQNICLLHQHPSAPPDLTVEDLVYYGRLPHKRWYEPRNDEDRQLVAWALERVGLAHYKDAPLGALSGGERQRAYIAQALCQRPDVLLLDEPTTYLDITYQLEVMELLNELNRELGLTVVIVLHELNQAIKYSDQLLVMKAGKIMEFGCPKETVSPDLIKDVYRIDCLVCPDPTSCKPHIFPLQSVR